MILHPELKALFEYRERSGVTKYTSKRQKRIDFVRLAQGLPDYFEDETALDEPQKKSLILALPESIDWNQLKLDQVKIKLAELLDEGFKLYLWQDGALVLLTDVSCVITKKSVRKKITPESDENLRVAVLMQHQLTADKVHILDDYQLDALCDETLIGPLEKYVSLGVCYHYRQNEDLGNARLDAVDRRIKCEHINKYIMDKNWRAGIEEVLSCTLYEDYKYLEIVPNNYLECSDDSMTSLSEIFLKDSNDRSIAVLKKMMFINFWAKSHCSVSLLKHLLTQNSQVKGLRLSECIIDGKADAADWENLTLEHLESLNLVSIECDQTIILALLKAASHLKSLALNNHYINSSELDACHWIELQCLDLRNIKQAMVEKALTKVPALRWLTLGYVTMTESFTAELPEQSFESLDLAQCNISGKNLNALLQSARCCKKLKLTNYVNTLANLNYPFTPFSSLESLMLYDYNLRHYAQLLHAVPNLKELSIDMSVGFEVLQELNFSCLETLSLRSPRPLNVNILKIFFKKHPTLRYLDLSQCPFLAIDDELQALLDGMKEVHLPRANNAPMRPMTFQAALSMPKGSSDSNATIAETSIVDTDTKLDPNKQFDVPQIFCAVDGGETPDVGNYRLNIYDTVFESRAINASIENAFTLANIEDIGLITKTDLQQEFSSVLNLNERTKKGCYYGEQVFNLDERWQPIASLSPADIMTHYHLSSHEGVEIQYSPRDNLYYIRTTGRAQTVTLDFLVKKGPLKTVPSSKKLRELVREYNTFKDGELQRERFETYAQAIHRKKVGACRHRAVAFKKWIETHPDKYPDVQVRIVNNGCHSFVEVKEGDKGEWITLDLGGYPAHVNVKPLDLNKRVAEATASLASSASSPVLQQKKPKKTRRPPVDDPNEIKKLLAEKEFETWTVHKPSESIEPKLYYQSLLTGKRAWAQDLLKKQLIHVPAEQLLALNMAIQTEAKATSRPVFYIHSPENLMHLSPFIERGADDRGIWRNGKSGSGPLQEFLNCLADYNRVDKARADNEFYCNPPLLIINYANFPADAIVGSYGVLDELPKEAMVVALMSTDKARSFNDEALSSRFDVTEKCPLKRIEMVEVFNKNAEDDACAEHDASVGERFFAPTSGPVGAKNLSPILPITQKPIIINLSHSRGWLSQLMGSWVMRHGEAYFEEGELVKALALNLPIEIRNPPKNDAFDIFWQQARLHGSIRQGGRVISFPATQKIAKQDFYDWEEPLSRVISSPVLSQIDSVESVLAKPETVHILNPSLLNDFLLCYGLDEDKKLDKSLGILGKHAKESLGLPLNIFVTRTLNDDQWDIFFNEMQKYPELNVSIQVAPDVKLPEALKHLQTLPEKPKKPWCHENYPNHEIIEKTTCIYSTDQDLTIAQITASYQGDNHDDPNAWMVFDVSECEDSDLIKQLELINKYEDAEGHLHMEFTEKEKVLITALRAGKNVLLTGNFSEKLMDGLAAFLMERANDPDATGKLVLVMQKSHSFLNASNSYAGINVEMLEHKVEAHDKQEALNKKFDVSVIAALEQEDPNYLQKSFVELNTRLQYIKHLVDSQNSTISVGAFPLWAPVNGLTQEEGVTRGSVGGQPQGPAPTEIDVSESSAEQIQNTHLEQSKQSKQANQSSQYAWKGLDKLRLTIDIKAFNPATSKEDAKAFMDKRRKDVDDALKAGEYVFLTGLTGVGKSYFVENECSTDKAETCPISSTEGRRDSDEGSVEARTADSEVELIGHVFAGKDPEQWIAWAQARSDNPLKNLILFLDEANLTPTQWTMFEGLFHKPRYILINGIPYPLTSQHKVIFAGNPLTYGDDRQIASLFKRHGKSIIFEPLSTAFIYEETIKPIFGTELTQSESEKAATEILKVYQFLINRSREDVLISPRQVQMMAQLIVDYHRHYPTMPIEDIAKFHARRVALNLVPEKNKKEFDEAFPAEEILQAKNIEHLKLFKQSCESKKSDAAYNAAENSSAQSIQYTHTASRDDTLLSLIDLLSIRDNQLHKKDLNHHQKYGGLNRMVIEGKPGIGKTRLLATLLKQLDIREIKFDSDGIPLYQNTDGFCRLSADMPIKTIEERLLLAFDNGWIVLGDELNSLPQLEALMNSLMEGRHPKEKRGPHNDGFRLWVTQNPPTKSGRRLASPALSNRTQMLYLSEYSTEEMKEVLEKRGLSKETSDTLVTAFQKKVAEAKQKHLNPAPVFRNLIKAAKKRVKADASLSAPRLCEDDRRCVDDSSEDDSFPTENPLTEEELLLAMLQNPEAIRQFIQSLNPARIRIMPEAIWHEIFKNLDAFIQYLPYFNLSSSANESTESLATLLKLSVIKAILEREITDISTFLKYIESFKNVEINNTKDKDLIFVNLSDEKFSALFSTQEALTQVAEKLTKKQLKDLIICLFRKDKLTQVLPNPQALNDFLGRHYKQMSQQDKQVFQSANEFAAKQLLEQCGELGNQIWSQIQRIHKESASSFFSIYKKTSEDKKRAIINALQQAPEKDAHGWLAKAVNDPQSDLHRALSFARARLSDKAETNTSSRSLKAVSARATKTWLEEEKSYVEDNSINIEIIEKIIAQINHLERGAKSYWPVWRGCEAELTHLLDALNNIIAQCPLRETADSYDFEEMLQMPENKLCLALKNIEPSHCIEGGNWHEYFRPAVSAVLTVQ